MGASDFSVQSVKGSGGTWQPEYSYGYGAKWLSGWSFKPDKPPCCANSQPKAPTPAEITPEQQITTKKPKPALGASQARAKAGDTVPIVFGYRQTVGSGATIGGVWVQPALVKTGSIVVNNIQLFALSQGELWSWPDDTKKWVGNRCFKYSPYLDNNITYYDYLSSAASEASPNTCPLFMSTTAGLKKFFCDYDVFSFQGNLLTTSGGTVRQPDIANNYHTLYELTKGTGDTNNSVIRYNNSVIEVYDSLTGNDVTAAYWSYLGINPAVTFSYINAVYSGGTITGGRDVGTATGVIGSVSSWTAPTGAVPYSTGPVNFKYGNGTLIKQINAGLPADTGTLYGVLQEWRITPTSTPETPASTKDFTNYSDITWMSVQADLFDPNNGDNYDSTLPEDVPTDFRQLSVFFEYCVSVDLYSVGLVGGVYFQSPSNQFVDLAMYMFTLMKRANGINTDSLAAPINTSNLTSLANFNYAEELFFNGIVDQAVNVIEYLSQTAPYFLLSFISAGGQYSLKFGLPVYLTGGFYRIDDTAQTSTVFGTFNESIILPGSFQKKYFNSDEQRPICVSVIWSESNPEVVGKQNTTIVRYPETPIDAPTVQFDMSDFCTSKAHAVKYAKLELARRRYSTHAISFATQLGVLVGFEPTDIIKVERQRINSRGDNRTETGIYQITKLTHTTDGVTLVEAAYFPLNASDKFAINDDIVNGTFVVT